MGQLSVRACKQARDKALWYYKQGMVEEARQIYRDVFKVYINDLREFLPRFRSTSLIEFRATKRLLKR